MTFALRVSVSPDRIDAAPGEASAVEVTIRNISDVVDHYGIDVLGLPEGGAARAEPEVTKLRPGETGTATVRLTLPQKPLTAAGSYNLGVLVRSRYGNENASRCEELPMTVAPVEGVTVRVEPEVATGGRAARYTVQISNSGNTPQRLRLRSTDPERRVAAAFQPPTLDLPPGAASHALLAVHAPVPWNKEKQRVLTIEAAGAGTTGSSTATFVQKPRFASKLTRVAGIMAAVLVMAGAVLGAALIAKSRGEDKPNGVASQGPDNQAPSGAPSGGSSPGATPSGGATPTAPGTSGPPQGSPGATTPRTVDLTRPGGKPAEGVLPDDAFRADGILVSADPDDDGSAPECVDAKVVAVGGDDKGKFITGAHPDNPTTCTFVPVLIRFVDPVAAVEVTVGGSGRRRMEVHYRDLFIDQADKLRASDDGRHGGIDFVVIRGIPADLTATPPVAAVRTVKFTPMAPPG